MHTFKLTNDGEDESLFLGAMLEAIKNGSSEYVDMDPSQSLKITYEKE